MISPNGPASRQARSLDCSVIWRDLLTDYLADGYNVKLGEIGTFSATLTSRKVTDEEDTPGSVHFDSVKFNPTRHFVKEVYRKDEMELEHADPTYGFKHLSPKHTQEERFGMLMEYLRNSPSSPAKGVLTLSCANGFGR